MLYFLDFTDFQRENEAVSEFPWKPEGGTVVLFKAKNLSQNEDWRANGHRFYQINGGRQVMNGLAFPTVELQQKGTFKY